MSAAIGLNGSTRTHRIAAMQPREPAPTTLTRLPPADPPAADALRALADHGAHFVLAESTSKRPISKAWEAAPPDFAAVLAWAGKGGLVGVVPSSLGAVVVDVDDDAPAPPVGQCVLQTATRRAGGRHFWYRAPDGEVRNRKWLHGDVRGSRGFVVLWDPGAVGCASHAPSGSGSVAPRHTTDSLSNG